MRRVYLVLLMLAGIPAIIWLGFLAVYWAWATATPFPDVDLARKRFWLSSVPCVVLVVMEFAALWWLLSWRRITHARRHKKGLCVNCGYNLTGNMSGICPECGKKI